jgi:hypothetical protein
MAVYKLELCEAGVPRKIYETDDFLLAHERFLEEQLKILKRERTAQVPLYTIATLIGPNGIIYTTDPSLEYGALFFTTAHKTHDDKPAAGYIK